MLPVPFALVYLSAVQKYGTQRELHGRASFKSISTKYRAALYYHLQFQTASTTNVIKDEIEKNPLKVMLIITELTAAVLEYFSTRFDLIQLESFLFHSDSIGSIVKPFWLQESDFST